MAKKMVGFGEILLRLTPKGYDRFVQAEEFVAKYTGAEANAAVSVVNYGLEAYIVSKIPANEIGQACINYLRRFGVNTDYIARGGERLGLFYLETGAAQRASKVIYDRSHSSIRESKPEDYDWEAIFDGKDWFHFSGTAPALGDNVIRVLEDGLKVARKKGVMVSVDLNYRSKLWSPEQAGRVMTKLMDYVDVLVANEEHADLIFGVRPRSGGSTEAKQTESLKDVAVQLAETFGLKCVAITLREGATASVNSLGALLYDGRDHYLSRKYEINPIVDRVGGGDAFTGGLIYSMLSDFDPQHCVEFAVAAACLKHSIPGDFSLCSLKEVETLLAGDAAGRVQR